MADSSPLASPPSTGSVTGVPLDQPHRGITLVGAVKRFVRKYATFEGRASRSEFWWVMLVLAIVVLLLEFLGDVGTYLTAAFLVATVVPFLATDVSGAPATVTFTVTSASGASLGRTTVGVGG